MKRRKSRRQQSVETMSFTGPLAAVGATTTANYYLNAAFILSNINRKAFHQVTKSGHIKSYGLGLSVFNCKNASTAVYTAPNNYVTENATRAWHFARKQRYADAGFSLRDLGHGERLRFGLDATSAAYNQVTDTSWLRPLHIDNDTDSRGEWDLSDIIIVPPLDSPDSGSEAIYEYDLYDSFYLYLTGDHVVQATGDAIRYTGVGMNQSWTENRRGWATPSAAEAIQPENPLAFARMSESVSKEIGEEVADEQLQSPPYSNTDDAASESVFAKLVLSGQLESTFPNVTTNNDLIVCPGGLAKIAITNNDGGAAYPYLSMQLIELN